MRFAKTSKRIKRIKPIVCLLLSVAAGLVLIPIRTSLRLGSNDSKKYENLSGTNLILQETSDNIKKFPCHYITDRSNEFEIVPHFLSQHDEGNHKSDDRYSVSIATMISPSVSLFKRLKETARRWSGPISVAVFISDSSYKDQVELEIQQFKNDNSRIFGTRISFHLVTDLEEGRGRDVNMFPRNLMRNVAINNADANYVLLLDADLAPSVGSYESLRKHIQELEEEEGDVKHAIVVPAFEKSQSSKFKNFLVNTKEEMRALKKIESDSVLPFLLKSKLAAQKATNTTKWYTTSKRYSVSYADDYEPYVVVRKDANLPPFWEHFVGFGRNKLQWIEELFVAGYKFTVVPDVFVLHKWHESYGLRKVRPYIADEYVLRFQRYLKFAYGRSTKSVESLEKWRLNSVRKWGKEVVPKGQTTKFTSRGKMQEMSKKRMSEIKSCLHLVNVKIFISSQTSTKSIHTVM